jgi:hypothetical protein
MIGKGMPSIQSKAPRPKPMVSSFVGLTGKKHDENYQPDWHS